MMYSAPTHIRRWGVIAALALLALVAAGTVFEASGRPERPPRVLIVVDASASPDPALVAQAETALLRAERAGAVEGELRVTRTATEQLSVTHYFAVRRFDAIVGVGLNRRVAVTPVARRFPGVRFSAAEPGGVGTALRRAVATASR